MSLSLSQIAIAVPELENIQKKLTELSLEIEETHDVPTEKVRVGMVAVPASPEFRLEFMEPTASDSPISKFLSQRPHGGLHHIAFAVNNLEQWATKLPEKGFEVLPPGIRQGARARALFIHPRSFAGVLVELEEFTS